MQCASVHVLFCIFAFVFYICVLYIVFLYLVSEGNVCIRAGLQCISSSVYPLCSALETENKPASLKGLRYFQLYRKVGCAVCIRAGLQCISSVFPLGSVSAPLLLLLLLLPISAQLPWIPIHAPQITLIFSKPNRRR